MTGLDRLVAAAREKRLVVFAGAGMSVAPPTSLPSWWALSGSVIRSIARRGERGVPDVIALGELVVKRQASDHLPPDFVAEKIVYSTREKYFEVLRCIDSDRPNANHLALAELAAAGKIRAIVTTNFDRTTESAFHARGLPLDVRADLGATRHLLDRWTAFESGELPCQLIKIHGTADRPETIIDTLQQRARGTPPEVLEVVRRLLDFGTWGFFGFSGADLETQHDYLGLAKAFGSGKGITWLIEAGTKPRAGVTRLIETWSGKAETLEGRLPDVLIDLLDGTNPLQPSDEEGPAVDLDAAADAWSRDIPERRCALIIAELAHASGETARARATLETLVAAYPQHSWKITTRWSGDTLLLKADGEPGAPFDQPRGFGDPAKPAVVALLPQIDPAVADWQVYSDALYGLADCLAALGESVASEIAHRCILAGLFAGGRTRVVRGLGILGDLRSGEASEADAVEAERLYALALSQANANSLIWANLMVNRGRNLMRLGVNEQAFPILMAASDAFGRRGDETGRAGVGLALASLSLRVGQPRYAVLFWNDVLEFSRRVGNEPMRFEASLGLGCLHVTEGRRDEGVAAFRDALDAARHLGDKDRESSVRSAMLRFDVDDA